MASARISDSTKRTVRVLAQESGDSMQAIIEKAVELYRRQRFLAKSNRAYAALRAKPEAWRDEQQERAIWDAASADDLAEA